ncbi:MAG TPA: hypothetical protein VII97_04100 [Anaerolineales bacterium]
MDAAIQCLSDTLIDEIINAVGLPKTARTQRIFNLLFHKAAGRLAEIGVTFDRLIASDGFPSACAWALTNWCHDITARGSESVPQTGPLLVISNHAGAYDSVVIAARLGRNDLKFIGSDVAFLKHLPNTSEHFLFVSEDDAYNRMTAVRSGIRHLQGGGALLLFGTGLIDPDPAVYPGAEKEIENWSSSIDLFLRKVPEANVVVAIVSGIVSPRWARHPVTWLKRIAWQKRRLAEFGQVLQQLFFPGRLYVSPRLSFAPPVPVAKLRRESGTNRVLPAVIAGGKALLAEHIAWTQTLQKE